MPLTYALVSRQANVLAEHTPEGVTGNFSTIARVLLKKLPTTTPASSSSSNDTTTTRRSFEHDSYAFHTLQQQHPPITYLVMADKQFPRAAAMQFLDTIQQRFTSQYGTHSDTAIAYAYQNDFGRVLKQQLERINEEQASGNTITQIRTGLSDVKEQMVENIDKVIMRGERIELLVDKSEELETRAIKFERSSRGLRRGMLWKNAKWGIILFVVLALIVLGIIMGFCGADFHKCRHS